MVLKSYAKINLSLSVNKKLKSGFHDIQSIYCLIDLNDKILVKKIKNNHSDVISFSGPFSKHVNKSDNSIQKILSLMRTNKLIKGYYSIKVQKKIPVFGGFGGGTSNAATLLKELTKKKIDKKIFNKIINVIGSDLRLFSTNHGFQKSLKSIIQLKKKHKFYFLLVFPMINSSTKNVYSNIKKYSKSNKLQKTNVDLKENFINYLKNSNNDLQSIVEKQHPIIRQLLIKISSTKGCHFSRMTGSGSACFGLYTNKNCTKVALKKLRKKYPKFWISTAKTI